MHFKAIFDFYYIKDIDKIKLRKLLPDNIFENHFLNRRRVFCYILTVIYFRDFLLKIHT